MSRKVEDMKAEQLLADITNAWVWNNLKGIGNIVSYEREKDKTKQVRGTDIWLHTKNGTKISVDEKAQLYYINKGLPTFAFELDFIGQTGNIQKGWFLNDNLDTNMYLLIYPYATTDKISKLEYSSFTKLECILISKKAIWNELYKVGLTKDFLMQETMQMRKEKQIGKKFFDGIDWCYLNMSDPEQYSETPINIVIKKYKLMELANQLFLATPTKLYFGKGKEQGNVISFSLFGRMIQKTSNPPKWN